MKVVCLFSGGMDSTTLLYKLLAEGHEVIALSFDYGQTHRIELEYAKNLCTKLGVGRKVFDMRFLSSLGSVSSLLGGVGGNIVPCRNTLLITSAWALAEASGFDAVAIGAHEGDSSGFPDCRCAFLDQLESVLQLGSEKEITLLHPFTSMSKKSIVALGRSLGINYDDTYTCYTGTKVPCGVCASCRGRDEALS